MNTSVPFRIIPGITAGIGGLAYAGIPVTHRETNQSVTFLTGHDATGLVPDSMDWSSIAKGSSVIVMYMAMKHIGLIASRLIAAGRSKDEPIAFVCNATTGEQKVLETTLEKAETDVQQSGLRPPCHRCRWDRLCACVPHSTGSVRSEGRVLKQDPLGTRREKDAG